MFRFVDVDGFNVVVVGDDDDVCHVVVVAVGLNLLLLCVVLA